jgi:hypothetical protein
MTKTIAAIVAEKNAPNKGFIIPVNATNKPVLRTIGSRLLELSEGCKKLGARYLYATDHKIGRINLQSNPVDNTLQFGFGFDSVDFDVNASNQVAILSDSRRDRCMRIALSPGEANELASLSLEDADPGTSRYSCHSVVGGWQTFDSAAQQWVGPVFQSTTDLWKWQSKNLIC